VFAENLLVGRSECKLTMSIFRVSLQLIRTVHVEL